PPGTSSAARTSDCETAAPGRRRHTRGNRTSRAASPPLPGGARPAAALRRSGAGPRRPGRDTARGARRAPPGAGRRRAARVGAAPDPFMVQVYPVQPHKRASIPAVTHVDGSGRLQTVSRSASPEYWQLIKAFEKLSGVPVLLNTSFNENEPIVLTPVQALDCFLRTRMDALVLGSTGVEKGA